MEKIDMNWTGWSSKKNPFGKKFTQKARARMVEGSQMLLPFFKKYNKKMGTAVLEYGPFFNPLLTPKRFPDKSLFFWERRYLVRQHITKLFGKKVTPLSASFTTFKKSSLQALKKRTIKALKQKDFESGAFDSIIASQCFNYMDFKAFLSFARMFAKKGTLLFVNNSAGYGMVKKFSKKGSKTNKETLLEIKKNGFKIIEKKVFPIPLREDLKRIIVVAKFNGKN